MAAVTDNLNAYDKDTLTPLLYAVMKGHHKACKLLLTLLDENGLSLNKKDEMGFSPLHWSVSLQREDIARTFVEQGADINKKDMQGETPLFNAARNASEGILVMLLQNGASIDYRNNEGKTVMDIAKNARVKAILLKFGPKAENRSKTPLVIVGGVNEQQEVKVRNQGIFSLKEIMKLRFYGTVD